MVLVMCPIFDINSIQVVFEVDVINGNNINEHSVNSIKHVVFIKVFSSSITGLEKKRKKKVFDT